MMTWVSYEGICMFLLALLLTVIRCGASLQSCSPLDKPHPHGICGRKIDEALDIVCGKGGYVERKFNKRSVPDIDPNLLDVDAKTFLALSKQNAQLDATKPPIVDILLAGKQARNFLDKRGSFYQKGVSCECCYHSCSVGELAGYCKQSKKTSFSLFNL